MGNAGVVWRDNRRHRIRVLLVASSFTLRFGMGSILERNRFEIVGETGFDNQALSTAAELAPDVIIMDVLPLPAEQFATLRALKRYLSDTPILLVGQQDGSSDGQAVLEEALTCGADGYLPAGSPEPLVTSTVLALFYGSSVLPREAALQELRAHSPSLPTP